MYLNSVNFFYAIENLTHPFYTIENQYIPSMPLFLIFHSLYAIGVKNTNRAVKLKDKRTIIPLAPIPCPLSTTTDVWDPHIRFIFNLEPIGSTTATEGPAHAAEARAAPPPRPPSREPPHAPRPPSGPCRGRRQAGHHARRVLRHRPHPPPHPCSGAVTRCVLCRGPRRVLRRGPRPPRGVPPSLTYPHRRLPPAARPSSLAAGRASAALLPRRWASSTPPRGRASCGPGERAPPPSPLGELASPRGQASCGPGQRAPPPSPLSELRCLLARRRPSLSSSLAAGDPGGGELRRAP